MNLDLPLLILAVPIDQLEPPFEPEAVKLITGVLYIILIVPSLTNCTLLPAVAPTVI